MKTRFDPHFRRDLIKLTCVLAVIAGFGALFFLTPALSTPTFISVMVTMILSPLVASLERRGHNRTFSILIVFGIFTLIGTLLGAWAFHSAELQWESFREKAPGYFDATVAKLRVMEDHYRAKYPFLGSVQITDNIVTWGQETGKWFVTNGPAIMGNLLSCLFLVPVFTFLLLGDGPSIRKKFFQLIPNRFFEAVFLMSHEITLALSDYIRAKIVEATLVGGMTAIGLAMIGAPYATVLAVVAGVTNILPYIGPILGAVPAILIPLLDPAHAHLLWPITLVIVVVNIIDMVVIFPVIVAKLVDMHPLILIAVVAVGQQYYGLIGMLISIPIATAIKVVLQEIYTAVYEHRIRKNPTNTSYEVPLIGGG
jgi:putative permease